MYAYNIHMKYVICIHINIYVEAGGSLGDRRGQEMTTTEDHIKGNISDKYNIFSNLGV